MLTPLWILGGRLPAAFYGPSPGPLKEGLSQQVRMRSLLALCLQLSLSGRTLVTHPCPIPHSLIPVFLRVNKWGTRPVPQL